MSGAQPLLPLNTFLAWIGKTSPTFCQMYPLGLLPLLQRHSVSERVSETVHINSNKLTNQMQPARPRLTTLLPPHTRVKPEAVNAVVSS
jgi:hypothetical protein